MKEAVARLLSSRAGQAVVVPAPSQGLLPPRRLHARRAPRRRPARAAALGARHAAAARASSPTSQSRLPTRTWASSTTAPASARSSSSRTRAGPRPGTSRRASPPASAGRGAGTWRRARARRCRSPGGRTRWRSTSSPSSRCCSCSRSATPAPRAACPGQLDGGPGQADARSDAAPRRLGRERAARSSPPGTWSCGPRAARPSAARFPQLFDLSLAADDPEVAGFGGIALYRAEFDWTDETRTLLGLGTVHGVSSVRLNGKDLGTRWWGRHLYDAKGALAKGRNVLEVEVTTTLGNRMRSLKDNPVAKGWSWWFPPIPMGLVGPVQLMKPAAESSDRRGETRPYRIPDPRGTSRGVPRFIAMRPEPPAPCSPRWPESRSPSRRARRLARPRPPAAPARRRAKDAPGLPPLPEVSPRNASYTIEARLDPEKRTIAGTLVLEWRNTSDQALSTFPFHLYWNAFRNNLSTIARGEGRRAPGDRKREERTFGWTQVKSVRLLGEPEGADSRPDPHPPVPERGRERRRPHGDGGADRDARRPRRDRAASGSSGTRSCPTAASAARAGCTTTTSSRSGSRRSASSGRARGTATRSTPGRSSSRTSASTT